MQNIGKAGTATVLQHGNHEAGLKSKKVTQQTKGELNIWLKQVSGTNNLVFLKPPAVRSLLTLSMLFLSVCRQAHWTVYCPSYINLNYTLFYLPDTVPVYV